MVQYDHGLKLYLCRLISQGMPAQISRIIVFAMMVTWFSSCNQSVTSTELTQMEFEVEKALLADDPVVDSLLGISFMPPKQ